MYLYRWSRPGASRANLLDAVEPFQMQVGPVQVPLSDAAPAAPAGCIRGSQRRRLPYTVVA